MRLDDGWNQIQFNLSDFTRRAYGTNYIETLRVQVIIGQSFTFQWKWFPVYCADPCQLSHPQSVLLWQTLFWRWTASRVQAVPTCAKQSARKGTSDVCACMCACYPIGPICGCGITVVSLVCVLHYRLHQPNSSNSLQQLLLVLSPSPSLHTKTSSPFVLYNIIIIVVKKKYKQSTCMTKCATLTQSTSITTTQHYYTVTWYECHMTTLLFNGSAHSAPWSCPWDVCSGQTWGTQHQHQTRQTGTASHCTSWWLAWADRHSLPGPHVGLTAASACSHW